MAECARAQPGEPVAAAGAAAQDRQLVANESAAAVSKDGRTIGETRPVLLLASGREPSYEKVTWGDAPTDRSTVRARRLEGAVRIRINPNKSRTNGSRGRSICEGFPDGSARPFWNENREKGCVAAVRNRRNPDVRKEDTCSTRRVSLPLDTLRVKKEIPDLPVRQRRNRSFREQLRHPGGRTVPHRLEEDTRVYTALELGGQNGNCG